jgi:hypothetical protein
MFLNETNKKSLKALEDLNEVSAVCLLMTVQQSAAVGRTPYCLPECVMYSRIKKKQNFFYGLLTFHLLFASPDGNSYEASP